NRILGSMRLDLLQKGRLKDLCNPNSEGFIPFFISTGLKYRIFYLNLLRITIVDKSLLKTILL
ncbi:MAG: hypothetical protein IKH88_12400, partial [Prevotella sp.]|nr:hypothetical protein [Prevotella sp.]